MNCLECQQLLQRRLDGENLPGSLLLDQHLAGCQSCRHTYAAGSLMLEGLKVLPPVPQLPADFAQRMAGTIVRDRQHRRVRMRRRVWVTAGLAAAIMIMVWAGNIWLPQRNLPVVVDAPKPSDSPTPPAPKPSGDVKEQPIPIPHKPAVENAHLARNIETRRMRLPPIGHVENVENMTPLAKSMDDARSSVFALTSRLADQTKDQARLFVQMPPMEIPSFPVEARFPEEPLDPAAQSIRQAGQGVSEGLHTVSRNARRAVSFFMKELPMLDAAD